MTLHNLKFSQAREAEGFFGPDHQQGSEIVTSSYMLLDLPPELLEPILSRLHQKKAHPDSEELRMEFRGKDDDEVVLVTPEETYQLRTVQNSNSVLVCHTASQDEPPEELKVFKIVHETLELSNVTRFPGSRLEAIKQALLPHFYTGETNEAQRRAQPEAVQAPTFSSLSLQVPASDREIQTRLNELHVVELAGGLRMLSLGYLATLLSGLLNVIDELGIGPHEDFAIGPVVEILSARLDVHPLVVLQILKRFSSAQPSRLSFDLSSSSSFDGQQVTSVHVQEIVRLIGISQLLCIKPTKLDGQRTIQTIRTAAFLASWRSKLTEAFFDYCSIESLESHSTISDDHHHLIVIPIEKLSLDPKTRFSQLFELRPKWKLDEIDRFLLPITGGGQKKKLDELVLKFCRKLKPSTHDSDQSVWLSARNKW